MPTAIRHRIYHAPSEPWSQPVCGHHSTAVGDHAGSGGAVGPTFLFPNFTKFFKDFFSVIFSQREYLCHWFDQYYFLPIHAEHFTTWDNMSQAWIICNLRFFGVFLVWKSICSNKVGSLPSPRLVGSVIIVKATLFTDLKTIVCLQDNVYIWHTAPCIHYLTSPQRSVSTSV